ncbi:MAG: hypothetical protein HQ559_17925 [Lentisphaerae bacterium]|nr:hypothetical protein [Lentisphaerota bacterium]
MGETGALARYLRELDPETLQDRGAAARSRAEHMFAKDVVIEEYAKYYDVVCGGG